MNSPHIARRRLVILLLLFSSQYLSAQQRVSDTAVDDIRLSDERTYQQAPLADWQRRQVTALDQRMPLLMKQHHVPGAAVAMVFDRQLAWSRGYGVRCAGTDEPVEPDTVMEACSMSKPFFTYLLLKLVEQEKFDLDRPLVEYLEADYLADDPRHRAITARMTLLHTSGLPNWRKGGWKSGGPLSLAFKPGEKFRYSGEGFLMTQRALERAVESDLDRISRKRLIQPLGLRNTRFVWDKRFEPHSACGHDGDGRVKKARRYFDRANAAYTLYTTAEDYAKFVVEHLRRDRSAEHSISAHQLVAMLTVGSHGDESHGDRGLGWGLREVGGTRVVFHGGSNGTGFRCYCEFSPRTGNGFVIMTNAIGGRELWKSVVSSRLLPVNMDQRK